MLVQVLPFALDAAGILESPAFRTLKGVVVSAATVRIPRPTPSGR